MYKHRIMYNFGITSKNWGFIFLYNNLSGLCFGSPLSIIVRCSVEIQLGLLLLTCRCQRWVQASRRDDLRDKSTEYLSANCKLCADHFEPSQFMNSQIRKKLVWNAVPTVFQVPNPPKRIDGGRKPPKKRKIAVNPRLPMSVAKRKKIQSKNGCCFVFYIFLCVCICHK